MLIFLLIIAVSLIALVGWIVLSQRQQKQALTVIDSRIYAMHTQGKAIEPLEHSTGQSFGKLLRAARGDRSAVEKWITAEQYRGAQPLTRDEAIDLLAHRLDASRH
ncbi:hypothetical protein [Paludibacterium denitrificans]|uniref:Uncharacterized protein n=1 Tax=Paludibacterium denitrificans TaxID=2675226 RepID=A0A844GE47_9NEIS|nr:hypothetical protein [Paludibacterium denitrificans]MTD33014.1 hypothetical protein [Paludibacterium denitrificans]HJV07341.1 hypothetical protein [Chromobacteriaceae bacterium]